MDWIDVWLKLKRLIKCLLNRDLNKVFVHLILRLSKHMVDAYELIRNVLFVPSL